VIRVGITGHQNIPEAADAHIRQEVEKALRSWAETDGPVEVLSSLAAGADQIFARIALSGGARLTLVVPSKGYERAFSEAQGLAGYQELTACAAEQVLLDHAYPSEEAFHSAGVYIVDHADALVAVWDGQPAKGFGGTADIVDYARQKGKPVTVVWKEGVVRG
jgi:hypothetical protein